MNLWLGDDLIIPDNNMADERNIKMAQGAFATLCQALDDNEWIYNKDEGDLSIRCSAQGDDLPMEITVKVDVDRQLVMLMSHLPIVVPEEKRFELAVAVSFINNRLVDGCFDYDIKTGHMYFRMTNSFLESMMGKEAFVYMVFCSCHTIDDYNDKLLMLAKGIISIEQFLAQK